MIFHREIKGIEDYDGLLAWAELLCADGGRDTGSSREPPPTPDTDISKP